MFRQCTQASQESLAEYHVRLRTLAEKCDFGDRVDFEIKLQIVTNGTSTHLRKKALRDPDFTLKQMLEEGQRVEASTQQTTEIENTLLPGGEEEEEEESSAVEVESGDAEDERYIAEPFPVILPEDAETEEDEAVRRYPGPAPLGRELGHEEGKMAILRINPEVPSQFGTL
eukprot:gene16252-17893_t